MAELRDKAKQASTHSHSPYSNAKVGCAIEMNDGSIFQGCNVENASYGGTVCAERVAIWKAISEGKKRLKKVYVYTKTGWPPCGLCLQVMAEFADPTLEVTIGNEEGKELKKTLKDLLPEAFTPANLK
jgi:cytidine deaminase